MSNAVIVSSIERFGYKKVKDNQEGYRFVLTQRAPEDTIV